MTRVQKMTCEAFRHMEIPDGDTSIYELLNGNIVRRSSPHAKHQLAQSRLMRLIGNFVFEKKLGEVIGAPMDVVFDDDNVPQPDVFFIKKERTKIIELDGLVWGAPDLVVEIISQGTARNDRVDKKALYERCGVSEYWIVEPNARTVEVYVLNNQSYALLDFLEIEGTLKSQVLIGFELDITEVFN